MHFTGLCVCRVFNTQHNSAHGRLSVRAARPHGAAAAEHMVGGEEVHDTLLLLDVSREARDLLLALGYVQYRQSTV